MNDDVLLVEDDLITSKAMRRILTHQGYRVTWVSSVSRALEEIDRQIFGWIILDIVLPDGNGVRVQEKVLLLKLPTKIIVLSACADDRLLSAAWLKPHAMICKPIEIVSLLSTMHGDASNYSQAKPGHLLQ